MNEMNDDKKTILSIFAHPDDELGSIGTLSNHVERGDRVIMSWTTCGEMTTLLKDLDIEEVKKERKRHGQEIVNIVGAEKAIFLDLGDTYIQNTREQRLTVADLYVQEKPDVVITWGLNNNHPDHRYTGYLALDAIKLARINAVNNGQSHRKDVKLFHYFESQSRLPVRYVDVSETSMEKAVSCANFYAEIYDWKNVDSWVIDRRKARGLESSTKYAEKYNVQFDFSKPSMYIC
ncbi:MAG: PIG-L family deacetylase [Candidatus Heimdallarchaeota archaeon]|nr:PIG-L family deacetylase [Candidatus Heimdallarchaeota archaeon]